MIRNDKELVNRMSAFGITCSYDDACFRFKWSAAPAAFTIQNWLDYPMSASCRWLVIILMLRQCLRIANNLLTLDVIVTTKRNKTDSEYQIICIRKTDMAHRLRSHRSKICQTKKRLTLLHQSATIAHTITAMTRDRANKIGIACVQEILSKPSCPEFNG